MDVSEEEQGQARAAGNVVDRVGRMRNKLVQLAQSGSDEDRAFAVEHLKALNEKYGGLSRPGESPTTEQNQEDTSPSKPLIGGFNGKGEENPGFLRRLDTGLGMTIMHPEKLANPAWRRQMIGELDKGFTGGAITRVGRAITEPFGAKDMSPEAMQEYAKTTPLSDTDRLVAQAGGSMLPGSISRVAGGAAERGLMNLPGMGAAARAMPKLVGAGVGAASAAAGAGAQAGTQAALTPGVGLPQALGTAWQAAKNPVTLAMGAAGGAAAGAGHDIRENNPNVRMIEDRGGRVSMTDPGSGGELDNPLVQSGINPRSGSVTEAGKGHVARQAADATADMLQGRARAAGAELRAGTDAAESSGALSKPEDVTALYVQAQQMAADPRLPHAARSKIKTEVLDDYLHPLAEAQSPHDPLMMDAGEANQLKQKLWELAQPTAPGQAGTADPHFTKLAREAGEHVGETLKGLNAKAKGTYDAVESARESLGIPGSATEDIPQSQRLTLANTLGRRGADTRTAGKDINPGIDETIKKFPELRQLIEAPELLQARGNLEFGTGGKVGGLYEKIKASGMSPLAFLQRNYDPATVRILARLLIGGGNTLRAAAPASGSFIENLGEGARRKMDQR